MSETSNRKQGSNFTNFLAVGLIALLIGGLAVYLFLPKGGGLSQAEVNSAISNATASKDATIADLQARLAAKSNRTTGTIGGGTVTVIKETGGYLIDDLFLEAPFSKTLSDREVSLFDGKVDFNGDAYDADETFSIDNLKLKANGNDFEGKAYLTVPEGSLSYKMAFEPSLVTSKIGIDDETLTFDFLGKEVEISSWDSNEITFSQGEKHLLKEGENITVEGRNVQLVYVTEKEILVKVDGFQAVISEGKSKTIYGLEVKAFEVLYSQNREGQAVLIIGKDVEQTISDGEEYGNNSSWIWTIDSSSIGLRLNEGYLDLDEDFSALAPKDEVCLPNRYICVRYDGLSDVSREQYTFDIDGSYVLAKGDFVSGVNDYSRVYINQSSGKIYEKVGSNYNLISATEISLGNTDSLLKLIAGKIVIKDFEVNLDLSSTNVGPNDFNWMTNYGIFVKNTKNALEDKFFTITVPDEKISGSITIKDINFKEVTNSTA